MKIVNSLKTTAMALAFIFCLYGCGHSETPRPSEKLTPVTTYKQSEPNPISEASLPKVYMTSDISPEGLMSVYKALDKVPQGKIAVKISTGEPPASNYLRPAFIKDFVKSVKGTIVECNTTYGGERDTTESHMKVIRAHGFTDIAKVDIMDSEGEIGLAVKGGKHLKKNLVGSHFKNYDFYIVLSHFKGHAMGGFGGAIKNTAIGIASSHGKALIHTAGLSRTVTDWSNTSEEQMAFLEAMAEAAKSVSDSLANGKNIIYINVMNHMSVDCDCNGNPTPSEMKDIGILASTDPVALDQACIDLVYKAPDGKALIERIESQYGLHTLERAEQIQLGSRKYQLIKLSGNKNKL